ncbi:MAG: 3' terminal RNA ribose 2'-O-methyltransferase Hen1 [Myxococcota bacterium]
MLLTISTTHRPATDLGYLLAKHPDKCQSFSVAYGKVHVFYPEVTPERCTAALLLDFDPVGLVRGRQRSDLGLASYVNDRPYVASSFLSVAIGRVFSSALKGVSRERQELADTALPYEVCITSVPARGGEGLLRALFEPLGYTVEAERLPLDESFLPPAGGLASAAPRARTLKSPPEGGPGSMFRLTLKGIARLADLLSHVYVLLPVLDNQKHYWVGEDEVEKLIEKAAGWLKDHPERDQITRRYLKNRRSLYRSAMERLIGEESEGDEDETLAEEVLERSLSLNEQRIATVVQTVKDLGAGRVLDLGCGEGRLLTALLKDPAFVKVVGVDVSVRALEIASDRLKLDRMPELKRRRVELFQSSLAYRDSRFSECDVACAVEVIEHVDESRLGALERVLFEFAGPPAVIITTPNADYNVLFETLPAGKMRHRDHRFEWTRDQFRGWAQAVAARHGYSVRFEGIGPKDESLGSPTQMGVFER